MCATFELGGKKVQISLQKITTDVFVCQHSVCMLPEWSRKDSTDQKMAQKERIAMFGHLGLK